ncbi:MAG: hypothetical protein LBM74_01045 [Oscillospiraceae bacterium]|jgi:hypothetical protein|nr:hypothetical protein [Oscillospiraceae bacterium]
MKELRAGVLLRGGLRMLGYQLIFGFLGFMFAPTLITASPVIRIGLLGLMVLGVWGMLFMDGVSRGEQDCALGGTLDKLTKKGQYTPSAAENARRFDRLRGALQPLVGILPLLLAAVYVSLTAVPYSYTLQDAPAWLAPYANRPEVSGALTYLADAGMVPALTDYVRIAVRFVLFPYVGLMGEMGDAASLWFDRLSPLILLLMPILAAVGYQFGPQQRAKTVKKLAEAKYAPRKRLKQAAKKRLSSEPEKKQLI